MERGNVIHIHFRLEMQQEVRPNIGIIQRRAVWIIAIVIDLRRGQTVQAAHLTGGVARVVHLEPAVVEEFQLRWRRLSVFETIRIQRTEQMAEQIFIVVHGCLSRIVESRSGLHVLQYENNKLNMPTIARRRPRIVPAPLLRSAE